MTADQIRQSFLDFFKDRDHKVMAGTSLIPDDPTTLFTSAGVQQFVPAFRGDVPVPNPRIATCQKCLRADDIDEVGDTTHETFFEMLGNFSIGDYFKKEAIEWAWQYSIDVLDLPKDKIWITVHPQDDEAFTAWHKIGIPEGRIVKLEENWWPLSDNWVGSTGACSELYLDLGEKKGCGKPSCAPDCSCGRFVEYWNLVFPEFFQEGPGNRRPLERPGVDTGLGFERLAALLQGKDNIFETDIFQPIVEAIHARAAELNSGYEPNPQDERAVRAVRIIADHSRAVAFSLSEGILPSNEGRGYVVRRLLRRAAYLGLKTASLLSSGESAPFVTPIVKRVCETMGGAYHELQDRLDFILANTEAEEKRFDDAIEGGFQILDRMLKKAQEQKTKISGTDLFTLYDTFGIPKELTSEIASERGLEVALEDFDKELEKQRARSRAATGDKFAIQRTGAYQPFIDKTEFVGYDKTELEVEILGIVKGDASVEALFEGEAEIILNQTPFYAEQGGQVGDRGKLEADGLSCEVLDTTYPLEGIISHRVSLKEGSLRVGQKVRATVDTERRRAIARAHTATHLLHCALREVLGPHALQSGSMVDADWLRFDFSHFEAVSREQLDQISAIVNRNILENHHVEASHTDKEAARQMGAMALFGEKYGEKVRVVQIGQFSCELCGGTHLHSTAEVGAFVIASEASVGAGLRRIEAYCGLEAIAYLRGKQEILSRAALALRAQEDDLPARIDSLQEELRKAQRQNASLQQKQAGDLAGDLISGAKKVNGISVIAAKVPPLSADALRNLADKLVEKLGGGIVILAAPGEKQAPMVAKVSKELIEKGFHAGKLLGEVAKIAGGGGGGRPDFAQAGAKDLSRLDEALEHLFVLVKRD